MSPEVNLDALLELVDPFGPFQWILCAFLWVLTAPLLAAVIYGHMLLLLIPEHWCVTLDPAGINRTVLQRKLEDIPFENDLTPSRNVFSRCQMYVPVPYPSITKNLEWNLTNIRQITVCDNGFEYDYSNIYSTVVSELDWVCNNAWKTYTAHTAFWAGGAVGVVFFGTIADRFGRRPVIVVTHLMCAVFGVATNFFTSFPAFIVGRIVMGFAALPMSMATYVLMLEYVSSSWRLTVSTVYLFMYSLMGCVLPWVAYFIADWRIFNLLTSIPIFVVPLLCRFIPESLRWMFANNQKEKAKKTLVNIARINGRQQTLSPDFLIIPLNANQDNKARRESVVTMIQLPNLRKIFFITIITWLFLSACYTGGYVHAATVSEINPFVMISVNSAMDLLANAIGDRMANRFGRRMTMVISSLLCSVTFLVSCCDSLKNSSVALTLILMIGRVTLTTAYNVNYLYGAEVYPTVVRTQALSVRQAVGAVGSFLSPQIVYLATYSRPFPLLIFSCMALTTSLLCLLLPETLNTSLPETLMDGEALEAVAWPFLSRLYDGISSKIPHKPSSTRTNPKLKVADENLQADKECIDRENSNGKVCFGLTKGANNC